MMDFGRLIGSVMVVFIGLTLVGEYKMALIFSPLIGIVFIIGSSIATYLDKKHDALVSAPEVRDSKQERRKK